MRDLRLISVIKFLRHVQDVHFVCLGPTNVYPNVVKLSGSLKLENAWIVILSVLEDALEMEAAIFVIFKIVQIVQLLIHVQHVK